MPTSSLTPLPKLSLGGRSLALTLVALIALNSLLVTSRPIASSSRKPPFNGSIFGKRSAAMASSAEPGPMQAALASQQQQQQQLLDSNLMLRLIASRCLAHNEALAMDGDSAALRQLGAVCEELIDLANSGGGGGSASASGWM